MLKRLLLGLVAVAVAAGVAYVWVVPEPLAPLGIGAARVPEPSQPSKDTSRVGAPDPAPTPAVAAGGTPELGVLDLDKLPFESGCGLLLSRDGEEEIVFADAATTEGGGNMPAAMVIDGALVTFERTAADGEPIGFGQYPRQVFVSSDKAVTLAVEVDLGESTNPQEAPVTSGELTVMKAGRPTLKLAVGGNAGC